MYEKHIILPKLTYNRKVWITGTEEEKLSAEAQYKKLEDTWASIIFSKDLVALEFFNNLNQLQVLSKSPRFSDAWQLSTFDNAGVVVSDSQYSCTGRDGYDWYALKTLVRELSMSVTHGQIVRILKEANEHEENK